MHNPNQARAHRHHAGFVSPSLLAALVILLVGCLACWGSYRHGRKVEADSQTVQRQNDLLTTAQAARADALTQARHEAQAARRADAAASRVKAIDREIQKLPPRPECNWTPDELRLAHARHCARYADQDPACSLPDPLQSSPDPPKPPHGMGTTD